MPELRVAHRTSPTNIGMGLLSTLAAHDLGYIGTARARWTSSRHCSTPSRGWSATKATCSTGTTRRASPRSSPRYVSTVDSGNLAGALIDARGRPARARANAADRTSVICQRRWPTPTRRALTTRWRDSRAATRTHPTVRSAPLQTAGATGRALRWRRTGRRASRTPRAMTGARRSSGSLDGCARTAGTPGRVEARLRGPVARRARSTRRRPSATTPGARARCDLADRALRRARRRHELRRSSTTAARRSSRSASGSRTPRARAASMPRTTTCWRPRRGSRASSPSPGATCPTGHWFRLGRAGEASRARPRWCPGAARCSST